MGFQDPAIGNVRLIANSALIVIGKAHTVDISAGTDLGPITRISFVLEEMLLGQSPGGTFDLEVAGGVLPDGRFLAISGSPAFAAGETYLTFIAAQNAASRAIANDYYGIFREVFIEGTSYFVNQAGRGIESVDAGGFFVGPILTDLVDTPLGVLQRRDPEKTLDSSIVALRAPGCMTRDAVRDALLQIINADPIARQPRMPQLRVTQPILITPQQPASLPMIPPVVSKP